MKNIKFLLFGTSLSCFPGLAFGQCVVTEDCATLGYTETSCPSNGVKCPFGNGWFCGGDEAAVCDKNGFKYTCTGTGYSGGSGQPCGGKYKTCNCATNYTWNGNSCALSCSSTYQYSCTGTGYAGGAGSACGGKYTQCTCASGYEWKNGECQKKEETEYYCDGKVVGVRAEGMGFFVSIDNIVNGSNFGMSWNTAALQAARSFCGNGRLPTVDELELIYNNKSRINALSTMAGGEKLRNVYHWSTSFSGNDNYHYALDMYDGSIDLYWGGNENGVRSVFEP